MNVGRAYTLIFLLQRRRFQVLYCDSCFAIIIIIIIVM
jgi:hypothetical protein